MLIELALLGSGATILWKRRKSRSRQLIKKTSHPFSSRRLIKDLHHAIRADGREQLQLDIDPERQQALAQEQQNNRRKMLYSLGATGLAVIGNVYPVFAIAGAVAVLYLSKEVFTLIHKDFKRGHFLSVYLVGFITILGMIATGHLILAALTGVMASFFASIINRLDNNSQRQLINVFSSHPQQVWLMRDGIEIQVNFQNLKAGDLIVVNAGEVIPVDGIIHDGEGQVDQHMLTGESRPVEKLQGEVVFASTLLLSGRVIIEVATAGNETMASKIGDVLNQTQSYKDTLINRGQKTADRLLPIELGVSAITLPLLGPTAALTILWSNLGTMMAPLGSLSVLNYLHILANHNILVKDGRVFESLRQVDTVVFDKTGTLTLEEPTVGNIHTLNGFDQTTVLRCAAAAEYRQPHPVAKAILSKAKAEDIQLPNVEEASYKVGYGIQVTVEGQVIRVGSARFMKREGIFTSQEELALINQHAEQESYSLVYVAIGQKMAGVLELKPTIRPEAEEVIQNLKKRNIKLYIISGDHEGPTKKMAEALGVNHYFAEVLPENKASHVENLKKEGRFVCFIGDGINDAIALKAAHISISLKGASTAATDTAQIIFMDGTLNKLETLFQFADEFEVSMRRNLLLSTLPGSTIIGGVYLSHFGLLTAMSITYFSGFIGLLSVLLPLIKHQIHSPNNENPTHSSASVQQKNIKQLEPPRDTKSGCSELHKIGKKGKK